MRIILCCLGLLFAAPALANSVEDGLCHARSQPVETMEKSEKLCRAFVRALGKLPGETMKEVQVMLSPESLALMGTMTTAWLGTQGIPVLGQTVDAALLTLGVVMAAAQTAAVKDALWNYVRSAADARDEAGLESVRRVIQKGVTQEFARYAAVINDPNTPAMALEVIICSLARPPQNGESRVKGLIF